MSTDVTSQPQSGPLLGVTTQPCSNYGTLAVTLTYGEGGADHDATVTLDGSGVVGAVESGKTVFRLDTEGTYTVRVTSARWAHSVEFVYKGVVRKDHHTAVTVPVELVPVLVRILDVAGATAAGPKRFKVYRRDDGNVVVEARTDPDEGAAWDQIVWGGQTDRAGDGDQANRKVIAKNTAREVRLTAALGGVTDEVTVAICQPPVLAPDIVRFGGAAHVVKNDARAFPQVSPQVHWLASRLDTENRIPACYRRNTRVTVGVSFTVTTQPTEAEPSVITGTSTVGGTLLTWTFAKDIDPGAANVTELDVESDVAIPNVVSVYEDQEIVWTLNVNGTGAVEIGRTRHLLYATLGAPQGSIAADDADPFWTLLDVSCRAANGDADAATLAGHVFARLTNLGVPIRRKRDNHRLGYWTAPHGNDSGRSTQELLDNADGSGQCGAWAYFFIDMLRVHGITSAERIEVKYRINAATIGFLVKNWNFSPAKNDVPESVRGGFFASMLYSVPTSRKDAFTHLKGSECKTRPPNGVPGQNKPSPPPQFSNHFIVRYGGQVYDPSYGVGPYVSFRAWENAAIAGLYTSYQGEMVAGYDNGKRVGGDPQLLSYICNHPGTSGVVRDTVVSPSGFLGGNLQVDR